ncbi:MAG: hypothetical protein H0X33_02425 [Taibaiella sp.]|nr:hypothetical protein [Taibaiella sp.]
MLPIHPQYITDTNGKKLVTLPAEEFKSILEELEDFSDIRIYDEAKANDDGERISFDEYIKTRKAKNG